MKKSDPLKIRQRFEKHRKPGLSFRVARFLNSISLSNNKGLLIKVWNKNIKDKPSSIAVESILLQSLIKPINIKRLYVEKRYASKAKEIVREFLRGGGDD